MSYGISKFRSRIIAALFLSLLIAGNVCAGNKEIILNPNQPVDLSNFKKTNGIWNLVKTSFPDAEIRILYSSGEIDYILFDLKHENSFLVFSSKPHATSFNLKINNLDYKEIKFCIVRHTLRKSQSVQNRFFGHFFQLEDGKACEIVSKGEYNEGNLIFNIKRDDKGLWLSSVIKEN